MLGAASKLAFLSAALVSVGASEPQDDFERLRQQMQNMPARSPAPGDAATAAAYAQWKAVSGTSQLPFDTYAAFLLGNPGWPGEATLRRSAEAKAGFAEPSAAVRYFRAFAPLTQSGRIAFARALVATGAPTEAADVARTAWRRGALAATDESWVLATFGPRLLSADHDARMDALLWAGQTAAGTRQLGFVSPGNRDLFAARLALRADTPEAAESAYALSDRFSGDGGYVADAARWLARSGGAGSARSWLERTRTLVTPPSDAEAYMEVLLQHARAAAAEGNWQQAYDIARQLDGVFAPGTDVAEQPYGERDEYTSLAWLAGNAALKRLGRPADAMTLFERYAGGTPTPSTRSKGLYWAARAADAARSPRAGELWAATAGFRDQFYGQLALERLGRPLSAPPPVAAGVVDPLTRAAFNNRGVVRAARMLGNVGAYEDQTVFIRQIALDAKSDVDHLLAADLARQLQRPDLGVMVGRSAMLNGHIDYSAAGFPTVPVPAALESDWTMIHAISRQESQFNRAAISHAGARGLMQLMPGTAREQAGKDGVTYVSSQLTTDPQLSMTLGTGYFRRVHAQFGSYPLALAAYNAGPGNVRKWLRLNGDPRTGAIDMIDWIEAIPVQETRNYVQRVLENAVVYDLMRPDRALSRGPANLSWYLGRQPTALARSQ